MGLRIDLRVANWLAHVLDEKSGIPVFAEKAGSWEEKEAIRLLLESIKGQLLSSPLREQEYEAIVERFDWRALESVSDDKFRQMLMDLRRFFADRRWTALIVPTGSDYEFDEFLCSEKFLRNMVRIRPDDPGLILQLKEPPNRDQILSLPDVFPAFHKAILDSTSWPGVLLWNRRRESVFLPFFTTSQSTALERGYWIFSHLSTTSGFSSEVFKEQYLRSIGKSSDYASRQITIVQLSDLHVGSSHAREALPRVQQLVRNVVKDAGGPSRVIPIVSGDLMDDPNDALLNEVRAFLDTLSGLTSHEPIVLIGNHDVRKDGYLAENCKFALRLPSRSGVHWLDDFEIGIAAFDSVVEGKLARGSIGNPQLFDIGSRIDAKKNGERYSLIGALHHHPTPVERPDWYARPFYERFLGDFFESTDELEDAKTFTKFAEHRRFAAILHGHKHIPRLSKTDGGVPIFGCGSSVGKVATKSGDALISVNVLTMDRSNDQVSGRLLVESVPGGGLQDYHTMLYRGDSPRGLAGDGTPPRRFA